MIRSRRGTVSSASASPSPTLAPTASAATPAVPRTTRSRGTAAVTTPTTAAATPAIRRTPRSSAGAAATPAPAPTTATTAAASSDGRQTRASGRKN